MVSQETKKIITLFPPNTEIKISPKEASAERAIKHKKMKSRNNLRGGGENNKYIERFEKKKKIE